MGQPEVQRDAAKKATTRRSHSCGYAEKSAGVARAGRLPELDRGRRDRLEGVRGGVLFVGVRGDQQDGPRTQAWRTRHGAGAGWGASVSRPDTSPA